MIRTIPESWWYRKSPIYRPSSNKTLIHEQALSVFRQDKLQKMSVVQSVEKGGVMRASGK